MILKSDTNQEKAAHNATAASFRDIVETHKRAIYFLSFDLTGNHHDAEDLSQEVFIKALKGLGNYRGDAQMYTWLRRIAINTYLNSRRRKSFSILGFTGDADREMDPVSLDRNPEQVAGDAVLGELVEKAMSNLSPRERAAFVLKYQQELSIAEISTEMEVADGTVKSLLFRATRKLQKSLAHLKESGLEVART
jgi:RNA polymerase sigma-70 factor (ECF subfamily)